MVENGDMNVYVCIEREGFSAKRDDSELTGSARKPWETSKANGKTSGISFLLFSRQLERNYIHSY